MILIFFVIIMEKLDTYILKVENLSSKIYSDTNSEFLFSTG